MPRAEPAAKPVVAVCGKGGAGKTVVAALLARAILDAGTGPILLIDADPAGGLVSALNQRVGQTLAGVRAEVLAAARQDRPVASLAEAVDYAALQALEERDGWSLLAMGYSAEDGCFCPANTLLREALDVIADPFAAVLIDAEAGLEQISRRVTRRVNRYLAVTDGSRRSAETLVHLADLVGPGRLSVIANRAAPGAHLRLPPGVTLAGAVPEDETLRQYDYQGRSLWDLPPDNPARQAVRTAARRLGWV
ncbi:MAG: hypothetical protein KJ621_16900 [Proteobacteria bacterium]|nr:hypothetical protein [Pseudomonadota bacterium]MBU1741053.1 hypothetical protein [Pseudomonadota bacterium]